MNRASVLFYNVSDFMLHSRQGNGMLSVNPDQPVYIQFCLHSVLYFIIARFSVDPEFIMLVHTLLYYFGKEVLGLGTC